MCLTSAPLLRPGSKPTDATRPCGFQRSEHTCSLSTRIRQVKGIRSLRMEHAEVPAAILKKKQAADSMKACFSLATVLASVGRCGHRVAQPRHQLLHHRGVASECLSNLFRSQPSAVSRLDRPFVSRHCKPAAHVQSRCQMFISLQLGVAQ